MQTEARERRDKLIVKDFKRMMKSGKEYTTDYMYRITGEKYYLNTTRTAHIINSHYNNDVITDEMVKSYTEVRQKPFKAQVKHYQESFNLCKNESRYILLYIKKKYPKSKN